MSIRIEKDLEIEVHDVFQVMQATRDTPIEEFVGADLVKMNSAQASQPHRHNQSETVLYFSAGKATVFINDVAHDVVAGMRILIHKGEFHSVSTPNDSGCEFLSGQVPPILSKATGFRDLETLEQAQSVEK